MEAHANGLKLYYTDSGQSSLPPIVFIHGFPFGHAMWQGQVELLKADHRVITYDLRGHGKSDVGDGQYLLEFFVDDLIALLDHLGVQKTTLCGLSMGGYIALRTVERNPDRVRSLVLCDTRSEADSNEAKLKRAASFKAVRKDGVPAFAEGFLKAVFAPRTLQTHLEAVDGVRRMILANSPQGICGSLLALAGRTDTTTALSEIRVPTLILVGEKDGITPPAAAQSMHEKIAQSEIHIIPAAGHLSNIENPVIFNKHLLEFLKTNRC